MDLLRIDRLRADLVPHSHWAVSRWFYANPIWYYHRRSAAHEICPGGRFYQLVDPDLRDVCRILHDAGVPTTPSCQGHSYPRDRFERIWDELKREEPAIRGDGLQVKDSENQNPYLFQDPDYTVPWPSFDDFYREAGNHQNIGYLGIVVPPEMDALSRRLRDDHYHSGATELRPEDETGRFLGASLFGVLVNEIDPTRRTQQWRNVTAYIDDVLHDASLKLPPADWHRGCITSGQATA